MELSAEAIWLATAAVDMCTGIAHVFANRCRTRPQADVLGRHRRVDVPVSPALGHLCRGVDF